MNTYLIIKWLHILSSVLMVGTGLGSAFYMFFANRSGSVPAQAVVSRLVVRADWWFTTPTVIVQPLTGFALAHMAGWPMSTPWLALSLGLFVLTGPAGCRSSGCRSAWRRWPRRRSVMACRCRLCMRVTSVAGSRWVTPHSSPWSRCSI